MAVIRGNMTIRSTFRCATRTWPGLASKRRVIVNFNSDAVRMIADYLLFAVKHGVASFPKCGPSQGPSAIL